MSTPHPAPLVPTLAGVVSAFQQALGYSDAELVAWLEMPAERLEELVDQPRPDPFAATYGQECQAVAHAVGCDPWSLSIILLWAAGRH